ncbi:hypothetical protein Adt_38846 [Abeliophyllum distichum]|uniref:Uncharacterized protein n=1 Tax=Abeliophyllum distichum TaxID=126358 RepID=A0ABD1Q3K8_9LAMI
MSPSIVLWMKGSLSPEAYETPKGKNNTILLPPPCPSSSATSSAGIRFEIREEASPCRRSGGTIGTCPPPSDSIHLERPVLEPDHTPLRSFGTSGGEAIASHSRTHLDARLYTHASESRLVR